MVSPECKLYKKIIVQDENGVEIENIDEKLIPIIKNEDIYSTEFYEASEQGHKITLRLRISALMYDQEQELEYMNKIYSVVRTTNPARNEIILICEEKVKNG